MNIFDQVKDLFESPNESIAERAEFVKECTERLQNNDILIDEYEELMDDILDLEIIEEFADDIDKKVEMKKALERLQKVVSLVKQVI